MKKKIRRKRAGSVAAGKDCAFVSEIDTEYGINGRTTSKVKIMCIIAGARMFAEIPMWGRCPFNLGAAVEIRIEKVK